MCTKFDKRSMNGVKINKKIKNLGFEGFFSEMD